MSDNLLERHDLKAVGVAWYSPETWKRLKAIPEARVEESYQDFLRTYKSRARQHEARGIGVAKLEVDLDHLTAWCHHRGYKIDSTGRSVYSIALTMATAVLDKPINITRAAQ